MEADWYGAAFGVSYSPTDRFTWGLGPHFLHGDLDGGSDYDADSQAWGVDAGLAARPQWGAFKPLLTAAFSATFHDLDQSRRDSVGGRYRSDPEANVYTLLGAASHEFFPTGGDSLILRPKLGLNWTRATFDGYEESTRRGLRPLSVSGGNYTSLQSDLGAALVFQPMETLNLEVRAAWLHEWRDRSPVLNSAIAGAGLGLFTPVANPSREAAGLGASADWSPTENLTLSLDYDAAIGDNLTSQAVSGTLRWDF